jgi:uncharacterized protein with beta-barrel porin domain
MGLLKRNNFSVRLLAILLSSIFLTSGLSKKAMAADGEPATTELTGASVNATTPTGLLESNLSGLENNTIDPNGNITLGAANDVDAVTINNGSATAQVLLTVTDSVGSGDTLTFAGDITIEDADTNDTLTINTTDANLTFLDSIVHGAGTNAVTITAGDGVGGTALTLTFDTDVNEVQAIAATINSKSEADNVTIAITNTSGNGAATMTFSEAIGGTGTTTAIDTLNIGTSTTTTFNSTVRADAINISNTNTTSFNGTVTGAIDFAANGTISVGNGANITGAITNTTTNEGTLTLLGTTTISGAVGSTGVGLAAINAGAAGTTATFSSAVKTTLLTTTGTGNIVLNNAFTGNLNFANAAGATITLADGFDFTGTITNTTGNEGILNVAGTSTFSGDVGSTGVGLNAINIQGSGKTVTFSGDLKATTTTISNLATLKFSKAVTTVTGSLTAAGTSGTIEVGTSTVTASGTVTFGASAKLGVTIGTTNGQLVATGGATLASGTTIVPTISGSLTSGTAIVILVDGNGGGIGTSVDNITITDNSSQYNFTLALNGNNLELTATAVTSDMSNNATAVNEVVDVAFVSDSTLSSALNGLAGTSKEGTALESLAPVVDGGSVIGTVLAGRAPLNTVSYRLASLRTGISAGQGLSAGDEVGEGKNFWLQGFGTYVDQSERQGIQGFEASTGGFAFGGDKQTSNTFLIGLVASYSYTDVNSRLSENQTYINSYQGTVYGTYDFGKNYLDAQFGLAYNDYTGNRFISVGAVDRQANAEYEGYQFLTKFELGRDLTLPNEFEFTPSLGLSWTHVEINDYTETGAGASNLIVNDQDYDILNLSLRGELRRTWDVNEGSLTPEVHLGYNYEAIDDQIQTVAAFTGGGNTFQSTGFDPANHSATGGTGLTYSGNNFDLVATYDFEAKQDFVSHSALLKGRWNF